MKNNVNKLNLIYFISFFADALITPFLALFFISIGIKGVKEGILLSLIPLSNLLGNLLYGKLSFNLKRNIRICFALLIVQMAVMMFYGFITNYGFLIIFTIIFALHNSPFFSIEDSLACKYAESENKSYAITRMFGSLGYLVSLVVGGIVTDYVPFKYLFLVASILFGISGFLTFLLVPLKGDENLEQNKISYKEIIKNKNFMLYLASYLLLIGSWQVGEAFLSTHYSNVGLSTSIWSYRYAFQVLMEIITMLVVQKLVKKVDKRILFLIAMFLMSGRSFLIFSIHNLNLLIFIEAPLRGIIWGLFLSSHVDLMSSIVSSSLMGKSITLLAILTSIITSIFEYITPYIFVDSLYTLYLFVGIIELIAVCIFIFLVYRRIGKKETISQSNK